MCKLKSSIEENKVKEFEEHCKEQITQIDLYIKVLLITLLAMLSYVYRNCAKTTTWTF